MIKRSVWWLGTLAAVVAGCASHKAAVRHGDDQAPLELRDYRIGPEDVIEISVWKNETVSRTVAVRPDGMLSLPLINDIKAAGLTPMELRAQLRAKLSHYIPNPEISVIVREVHSFKVSVFGEVAHPGRYELKGPVSLLDLLADAGGFTEFANRDEILILRPRADGVERIKVAEDDLVDGKGFDESLYLYSGDIVIVP